MSHPPTETRAGKGMTAAEIAIESLSVRPVTVRYLAGVLYSHGHSFTSADVLAKESLAALVKQGKAERREVHGVDLYVIASKTPMEKTRDD